MSEEGQQPQRPRPMARGPMGRGHGMVGGEKAKNFKGTWVKLIRYSRQFLPIVIVALVMAAVASVLQILGASKIQNLTDEITSIMQYPFTINMETVVSIAILLICLYVAAAILTFIQGWIMATVTQRISKKMRTDISTKINRLPFSYFNETSYGNVLSRVTNDVDTIGMTLNQSVTMLVTAIAMFIGSLIMMLVTDLTLALTAVGASLLGFVLMIIIVKKSQKYFMAQQNDLGEINGFVEETYTGHNIVKVYNGSAAFKRTFEETNAKLYNSGWKSQFLSGLMMPLMLFISNFGYVMVWIVGVVLALGSANPLSYFGIIFVFTIYVRLFTQTLSQFAQAMNALQRTAASSERVFEFIEEKEMDDESQKVKRLTDVKGDVEFRNVRFGYTPDKIVIKNFSAKVAAGQKIAIVGPTGAGKTTMVNLLMRFYEIESGEILLDGVPTNEIPRENVHEQFCMVLQDTWLFEGTIKENIIYSKQGVSDEQVTEACKMVGLHHFVQTLPDGYDTVLNDRASLSEGQKQLLTIARAIIKNSPLLILDEATSSVDTRTERIVQEAMDMLTHGRTSFIIAHRLSTIKNADVILVMKEGDIVESGNHAELLEQNGFYAELYNSQFETE